MQQASIGKWASCPPGSATTSWRRLPDAAVTASATINKGDGSCVGSPLGCTQPCGSIHQLPHQRVVLPPARPDSVDLLKKLGAFTQQAQPTHQPHILRTQTADRKPPKPPGRKHGQQGAVFKLTPHTWLHSNVLKPGIQSGP